LPVVKSNDLDQIGWAHRLADGTLSPNWASPPPPPFPNASGAPPNTVNLGYADAATDFLVRRVRFYLQGVTAPDFACELIAPSGISIGTANLTTSGWSVWLTLPTPVNGKGIWTVRINRQAGSSISPPQFFPDPTLGPGQGQSYVLPYGSNEGILGAEFEGEEVLPPVTVNVQRSVTGGACRPDGTRENAVFSLQFTPQLPSNWFYVVSWTSMLGTSPGGSSASGPLPSLRGTISYPPGLSGTDTVTATLTLIPPGGPPVSRTEQFTIALQSCIAPPPCPQISLTANPANACAAANAPARITFSAATTPAGYAGSYFWEVIDLATGASLAIPGGPIGGPVLAYLFGSVGSYEVRAEIRPPQGVCPEPYDRPRTTTRVIVTSCDCPTIAAPINPTPGPDGCTYSFTTQVSAPPGQQVTYLWDFGDGQTSTQAPPVSHRYAGTQGQRTVSVSLTVSGGTDRNGQPCADRQNVTVNVNCRGGDCPDLDGGISVTRRDGEPCIFDLTAAVRNPGGRATQLIWTLPDGSSLTAPTASVTLAPGASGTVSVTLRSPGCPDETREATLSCPGGGPSTISCDFLLWLATILFGLGGLLAIIGCLMRVFAQWPFVPGALNPQLFSIGMVIRVIGLGLMAIGVVLFILWWFLCRFITPCAVLRAVFEAMRVLKYVFYVILGLIGLLAVILGAFGLPLVFVVYQLLGCAGTALVTSLLYGIAQDMIDAIATQRQCRNWVSSAAGQSSQPLTGEADTRGMSRAAAPSLMTLGCAGCAARAEAIRSALRFTARRLALVGFGGHARVQREPADLAGPSTWLRSGIALQRIRIGRQRLQRRHLATGVRAGGDAVGDRTHPQRVHRLVAASAIRQVGRFARMIIFAVRGLATSSSWFRRISTRRWHWGKHG
jgi:hypothetical protein